MINLEIRKLKKTNTSSGIQWEIDVRDDGDVKRVLATGRGETPRDAARWLIHRINRVLNETESNLIELKLITESEIDAVTSSFWEEQVEVAGDT
jgi:hypothetical protein